MGCHFLLQCMKVKSEREVAQSCLTPSDPMDCSLPGSSVHGIFQARVLEWGAIAFSDINYTSIKFNITITSQNSYLYTCYVSLYNRIFTRSFPLNHCITLSSLVGPNPGRAVSLLGITERTEVRLTKERDGEFHWN